MPPNVFFFSPAFYFQNSDAWWVVINDPHSIVNISSRVNPIFYGIQAQCFMFNRKKIVTCQMRIYITSLNISQRHAIGGSEGLGIEDFLRDIYIVLCMDVKYLIG